MISAVMLGSGTSTGVPVVGCDCDVCRSPDERNRRSRASLWMHWRHRGTERSVVIDTGPDFRAQALRAGMSRLDAALFTHGHADHIFGLDDVRPFNFRQGTPLACFGAPETLAELRAVFAYAFEPPSGGGVPQLDLRPVTAGFDVYGETFTPFPVHHGPRRVTGYRVRDFAYVTDVSGIPEASRDRLRGLEVLVLGALRYSPHPTHFSIAEALDCVEELAPARAYLTHLAHDVDAGDLQVELPEGVTLGYDGLRFEIA